jgi:hypothetical protein
MTPERGDMPADMQSIGDASAGIYEAIATLEHGGSRATRGAVVAVTGLADEAVDQGLDELVGAGLLVAADDGGGEPVYVPASRGWSAAPERAEGHHLS